MTELSMGNSNFPEALKWIQDQLLDVLLLPESLQEALKQPNSYAAYRGTLIDLKTLNKEEK